MKPLLADIRIFLFLSFISVILILLDHFNILAFPKFAIQFLTAPVQYGFYHYGVDFKDQLGFIFVSRYQAQEYRALKIQMSDILAENSQLKSELNIAKARLEQQNSLSPQTYDLLSADIIGIGQKVILDKGQNDGVKIGNAVVYKDNYIGKVQSVSPKTSSILLPQDPDSKIAVFSQNKNGKAKGILIGEFASGLLMDKILHQEPIEVGDLVYSEGSEGDIARGLVMGKVSKVLDNQTSVFKQAEVTPIYQIEDLDLVYIMLGQ